MVATVLLLLALAAEPAKPTCLTQSGATACGFNCVSGSGPQVKCAQTPEGVCSTDHGRLLCFDPPSWLAPLIGAVPKAECKSSSNSVACGYHCVIGEGGAVACARTPKGVCRVAYGKVRCFDPPAEVYAAWGRDAPEPECRLQEGVIACGYACTGEGGTARCSQTPAGICRGALGNGTCFDPLPEVFCAYGKAVPAPECIERPSGFVCGYHCAQSHGQVRCAKTPDGVCSDDGDQVTCFDPPVTSLRRSVSDACLNAVRAEPTPAP